MARGCSGTSKSKILNSFMDDIFYACAIIMGAIFAIGFVPLAFLINLIGKKIGE